MGQFTPFWSFCPFFSSSILSLPSAFVLFEFSYFLSSLRWALDVKHIITISALLQKLIR